MGMQGTTIQYTLTWSITHDDRGAHLALSGTINEEANLEQVAHHLQQETRVGIDLSAISRITTSGIREWLHFIGPFSRDRSVELVRCSPAIVAQLNVFRDFTGKARVRSYQAPYLCPSCDAQMFVDIEVGSNDKAPDSMPCTQCAASMEFDEVRECYFTFLRWIHSPS
jgi:ABC-type transporter Mla MlaB component